MCKLFPVLCFLLLGGVQGADFCSACVSQGCVYCKAESTMAGMPGQGSSCDCGGDHSTAPNGDFFGGCNDLSLGSKPLQTSLDCTFNSPHGGAILAVIIILSLGVLMICCLCLRGRRSYQAPQENFIAYAVPNNYNAANNTPIYAAPVAAPMAYNVPNAASHTPSYAAPAPAPGYAPAPPTYDDTGYTTPAALPPPPSKKFCNSCGTTEMGGKFCSKCGKQF